MFKTLSSEGNYKLINLKQPDAVHEQVGCSKAVVTQRSVSASGLNSMTPDFGGQDELLQDLPERVITGADFNRLVKECPVDGISILRDQAITKIGDLHSNDPDVPKACGIYLIHLHMYFSYCLLAAHCTLLFIKVQYFARVMSPRASYVETLKTLIYNVRYFVLFIVLSMISAALSLAVLYKWEIDYKFQESNESLEDFHSFPRSLVSAYSILLGNFESAYVMDTENRIFKGVFFLYFQLFMSITVFNLLIAVMTESYKTAMTKENIIYARSRARIVDELELSLPKMFHPDFKRYVHFVVCEKRNKSRHELSTVGRNEATNPFECEMRNELKTLKELVEQLAHKVDQHLLKTE